MTCHLCSHEMHPMVINDPFDGEYNLLVCDGPIPHTRPFGFANLTSAFALRGRAMQLMEAAHAVR